MAQTSRFSRPKVGLIGPNGCGKSSLFALLRGEVHQDEGDVEMPVQMVMAHVAQETPASSTTALDYALDGDRELRALEADLARVEHEPADAPGHGEPGYGEQPAELHAHLTTSAATRHACAQRHHALWTRLQRKASAPGGRILRRLAPMRLNLAQGLDVPLGLVVAR